MEGFRYVDIFATKGIEYLIVIGFFILFAGFMTYLLGTGKRRPRRPRTLENVEWFRVPSKLQYHQGHAWAGSADDGTVSVGVDDFAQKLVGKVDRVELPPVGGAVTQGEPAWTLWIGSRPIRMLSPVDGEVVAINAAVTDKPDVVNNDPFGEGWLLRIKPTRPKANATALLSGKLAREWMMETLDRLRLAGSEGAGMVLQDGGEPVSGLARALSGEKWEETVKEYLHTP